MQRARGAARAREERTRWEGERRPEEGQGTGKNAIRGEEDGENSWVRGQTLRSCPLAPWVQLRVLGHTGCPDTPAHGYVSVEERVLV